MNNKLAMIGCGGIGGYHLGHFLEYGDLVELAGFCDLIPEKAEKFVAKAGSGKAYTDFRVMLDEVKPDMVFVCVPPYCHGEIEEELLAREIPFFVEKPLCLDIAFAKKVRDEIEKKGIITAVGFQCRYNNFTDACHDFCMNNQIVYADCTRFNDVPKVFWWRKKELSGGMLVESGIHNLDLLRYMMGDVVEVCSYATRGYVNDVEDYDTDDCSVTIARFESGALATIGMGCYSRSGDSFAPSMIFSAPTKRAEWRIGNSVEIYGEKPSEEKKDGPVYAVSGDGALGDSGEKIVVKRDIDAGLRCDRTFIEAVLTGDGSKIRSTYADAYKTLAFALACNESMATGKSIKIEY